MSPVCGGGQELYERKEPLLEDVEDGGKEEGQCQEDEQLVCQLPPVVLENQLAAEVDCSRHVFKLIVGFLYRSG